VDIGPLTSPVYSPCTSCTGGQAALAAEERQSETRRSSPAEQAADAASVGGAPEDRKALGQAGESAHAENEPGQSSSQARDPESAEYRELKQLQARDREVRAHEQAHLAAAGQYAKGGASFSYTRGPDGHSYATGGEVGISTSAVSGDPEATLQKAEQVRRAALAPAEPSAQDLKVAAEASATASRARQDIAEQSRSAGDGIKAYGEAGASESSERGGIDLRA